MAYSLITLRNIKTTTLSNDEVDNNFKSLQDCKVEIDDVTSENIPNKVVKRDDVGNITVNTVLCDNGITLGTSSFPGNNFTFYSTGDGTLRLGVYDINDTITDVLVFNGLCKLELPESVGLSGSVLSNNGSGVLSWTKAADIDILGNSHTVDNGVYTNGTYDNPTWITKLNVSKVLPTLANNANMFLKVAQNGTEVEWVAGTAAVTLSDDIPLLNNNTPSKGISGSTSRSDHVHPVRALTFGSGLTGSAYDGTTAVSVINSGVISLSVGTTGLTLTASTPGNLTLAGTLATKNGGTGSSLINPLPGSILYIDSNNTVKVTAVGEQNQILKSNGSGVPSWTYSSVTISTTTGSDLPHYPIFTSEISGPLTSARVNNDVNPLSNTYLSFIPSTGTLRAKVFSGAGTGLTGTASDLHIGGNAGTATKWKTPISFSLTGPITGSANSVDGNTAVSISTTLTQDVVTLGYHTTGNYVENITVGNYLTQTAVLGEKWTPIIGINATSANTYGHIVARDNAGSFSATSVNLDGKITVGKGSTNGLRFPDNAGDFASITLEQYGSVADDTKMAFRIGNDSTDVFDFINPLNQNGLLMNGNKVWHSGNQGHNSGLNADTVDTKHVQTSATNSDPDKLIITNGSGKLLLKNLQLSDENGGSNPRSSSIPLNIFGCDDSTNDVYSYKTSSFVAPKALTIGPSGGAGYSVCTTPTNSDASSLVKTDGYGYVDIYTLSTSGGNTGTASSPERLWGCSSGNSKFQSYLTSSLTAGRATTADKLTTARTISLTGVVTGQVSTTLDGNASITTRIGTLPVNSIPLSSISGLSTASVGTATNATNWTGAGSGTVLNATNWTGSSTYINQGVKTDSVPTFGNNYTQQNFINDPYLSGINATSLIIATAAGACHITFKQPDFAVRFGVSNNNAFVWGGLSAAATLMTLGTDGGLSTLKGVVAFSDIRLKTNLEIIPNALNKVSQLNGYTFDRIDIKTDRQTGVIAQEVELVLPEAVQTNEEGMKSVAYGNMVGILIEAIKELNAKVDKLEAQLALNS